MIFQARTASLEDYEYLRSFREVAMELRGASMSLIELLRVSPQHASDPSVSREYKAIHCLILRLPELRERIPMDALSDRISAGNFELVTLTAFWRANSCRRRALDEQREETQETWEVMASLEQRQHVVGEELRALDEAAKRAEAIKQASTSAEKDVASGEVFTVCCDSKAPVSHTVTASWDSKESSSISDTTTDPTTPETPSIYDAPIAATSETPAERSTASADEGQASTAASSPSDSIAFDEVVEAPAARGLDDLHGNGIKFFDVEEYEPVRVLGHGSWGVVWLVKRETCNKKTKFFAMKVMRAENPGEEAEIMNEVAVLEHLQGLSSAAQLYGAARQHGKIYLLFEFCPGGDLVARIREGHEKPITTNCGFVRFERVKWRMDNKQVRFYAACLIKSVAELHSRNIVHGDIKPDNIVLDSKGYLKLVDLGLAGYLEPGQKHRTALGTWPYVPPEVARMVLGCGSEDDGVGRAADWWAVGITIHEMLFGTTPFSAVDSNGNFDKEATLRMIAEEEFDPSRVSDGALRELLIGLLDPDHTTRLGAEGAERPEDHSFFKEIKWDLLAARTLPSPWQPAKGRILCSKDVHVPADHPAEQEYWVLGVSRRHSC